MASVQLIRHTPSWVPDLSSYRINLVISSAQDIPKELFVKQKIKNFVTNAFEEVFVAVCTPAQIADFPVNSPSEGSSYFRASSITLTFRTAEDMEEVINSINYEIQKLVKDYTVLSEFSEESTITISYEA